MNIFFTHYPRVISSTISFSKPQTTVMRVAGVLAASTLACFAARFCATHCFRVFHAIQDRKEQPRNLIILFNRLQQLNPALPRLTLETIDTEERKAAAIRTWMGENSDALAQITELNLSEAGLTQLPQEIGFFINLQTLSLARNRLATLPPGIIPAGVTTLDLSYNELTTLPPLPTWITTLDLSENRFRTLPRLPARVTTLDLSYNELTTLPPLPALVTTLDLSYNQLTTLPPLPTGVTTLNLCYNQFRTLPRLPAWITTLDLSENRFRTLPPLPVGVTTLNLSYNDLITLPPLPALVTTLDLSYNELTTLPEEIFTLHDCHVMAYGNRFSPAYAAELSGRLTNLRIAYPGRAAFRVEFSIFDETAATAPITLSAQLAQWAGEFATAFPQADHATFYTSRHTDFSALLSALRGNESANFSQYLARVREVQDYRTPGPSRNNVIRRVENMIQLACTDEAFRQAMLACIAEGMGTCGDRVLIMFNEIEIQRHLHCSRDLNDEQFAALAMDISRYACLKTHAQEVARAEHLGDEIEVILGFHLGLRELLFPRLITTEGMLYPAMSGVTPARLETARARIQAISELDLLSMSDPWLARMRLRHPNDVAHYDERSGTMMMQAEDFDYSMEGKPDALASLSSCDPELVPILKASTDYSKAAQRISQWRRQQIASLGWPICHGAQPSMH